MPSSKHCKIAVPSIIPFDFNYSGMPMLDRSIDVSAILGAKPDLKVMSVAYFQWFIQILQPIVFMKNITNSSSLDTHWRNDLVGCIDNIRGCLQHYQRSDSCFVLPYPVL